MLLHERIDARDLEPDLPVGLARLLAEEERPVEEQREDAEGDERQLQFIVNMNQRIPMIVKTSLKTITMPEENISFRTSMSFVTRVISRPIGFLSKNRIPSRWRWVKTCIRRSKIVCWPIHCVR